MEQEYGRMKHYSQNHLLEIQERNKQKEIEEKQRQEDLLNRQKQLREKIMNECRSLTRKPKAETGKETEEGSNFAQMLRMRSRGLGSTAPEINKGSLGEVKSHEVSAGMGSLKYGNDQSMEALSHIASKTSSNMKNYQAVSQLIQQSDNLPNPFRVAKLPGVGISSQSVPLARAVGSKLSIENGGGQKQIRLEPMRSFEAPKEDGGVGASKDWVIQRNISLIKQMPKNMTNVNNVADWLKKQRLDSDTKVFIVSPAYPDIKAALESRGWVENPDYESSCYHLKFSLKCRDIEYGHLESFQIVNHFEKAANITTKSGLTKSLHNLVWAAHADSDSFFPKCFDTSDESEFAAFTNYYRIIKSEAVIKSFVTAAETKGVDSVFASVEGRELQKLLPVAIKVNQRRLMDIDDIADYEGDFTDISEKEWEVIGCNEKKQSSEPSPQSSPEKQKKKSNNSKQFIIRKTNPQSITDLQPKQSTSEQIQQSKLLSNQSPSSQLSENSSSCTPTELLILCKEILSKLEEKFAQTRMNGDKNIWIIKPAGLSRGRGIKLMDSYADIYAATKGKDLPWVIQKYIERPLLYQGRKLDIRQWVMVTDWNPLVIWFYQECYVRLSTSKYDLGNISNKFSHLTNNSINKHAKNFEKEDGFLSQGDFSDFLVKNYPNMGADPFMERIQPKMKEIVINTLMCVQDMVENRKNSSEIYGYDFCIDEKLGVWLIEINASPAWDYSSVIFCKAVCH